MGRTRGGFVGWESFDRCPLNEIPQRDTNPFLIGSGSRVVESDDIMREGGAFRVA